jgi:hypothetical protein
VDIFTKARLAREEAMKKNEAGEAAEAPAPKPAPKTMSQAEFFKTDTSPEARAKRDAALAQALRNRK